MLNLVLLFCSHSTVQVWIVICQLCVLCLNIEALRQARLSRWQSALLVNSFQTTYFKTVTGPNVNVYCVFLSACHNVSPHIDLYGCLYSQQFYQQTLMKLYKMNENFVQQLQDNVSRFKKGLGMSSFVLEPGQIPSLTEHKISAIQQRWKVHYLGIRKYSFEVPIFSPLQC